MSFLIILTHGKVKTKRLIFSSPTRSAYFSTCSTHLSHRKIHQPIRLSPRSTPLSTPSICMSTRSTRLAILLSTRSTICRSLYN